RGTGPAGGAGTPGRGGAPASRQAEGEQPADGAGILVAVGPGFGCPHAARCPHCLHAWSTPPTDGPLACPVCGGAVVATPAAAVETGFSLPLPSSNTSARAASPPPPDAPPPALLTPPPPPAPPPRPGPP